MADEANINKLGADLREMSDDAEEMMNATTGMAGEKMAQLRNRLSSALDAAKNTYQKLQDKTVEGAKVADKTIREHPYESMGVVAGLSFGLGLLIGVLAARK